MRKIILSFVFIVVLSFDMFAQVSVGDIAFIAYNTDSPDNWAFVVLADIPSGETIKFTDRGWTGTDFYILSNEDSIVVTTTSTVSAGTIVSVNGTTFTPSIGTVSGTALSLFAGDQIICYQDVPSYPTFIAAIQGDYNSGDYNSTTKWNNGTNDNTTSSALPTGLTNGTNAVSLFPAIAELDNAQYNCTLTSGTKAELLAAINNYSNWTTDNSTTYSACAAAFTINALTPVELVFFTGILNDNSVELNWQTATEVNNYGFEIQRSVGQAISLSEEWETISFIPGHGNSNSANSYEFVDKVNDKEKDKDYIIKYRLKQIDTDGSYEYSDIVEVTINPQPTTFSLFQNYPNPFNPISNIKYEIANSGPVSLRVYNTLGEEVAMLVNTIQQPGSYEVQFDGSQLASGVYIYRLSTGGYTAEKIMLLIK